MSLVNRDVLTQYLNEILKPEDFKDYCPNGLQVEGREEIRTLVYGVTANQTLLDLAIANDADAILVHHGWFWRGENGAVTGIKRNRLKTILSKDISLYAYHLPLDAHAELGNNAQLAKEAGWLIEGNFGEQGLGCLGATQQKRSVNELSRDLEQLLGRQPLVICGNESRPIRRLAWCTGAAQGYFEAAIECGADVFVTGEISEPMVHLARETGVAYIAAGHHATERYGVRALGDAISKEFSIKVMELDVDSPV